MVREGMSAAKGRGRRRGRREAERRGRRAEIYAAAYLTLAGLRVLQRRLRTRGGEVDIVCLRKDTLIFVEVKSRATIDEAVEAVTARARRRIESAAMSFIAKRRNGARYGVRFDIIAIAGWRLAHIRDAWRQGE